MNNLPAVAIGLVVGIAVGALLAWLLTRDRFRASFLERLQQAEIRAAAAESLTGEFRQQVQQRNFELDSLRKRLEEEQKARIAAESVLRSEREKIQEEKRLADEARTQLSAAFRALADEALKSNNQAFLQLASQTFATLRAEASGDLEQRKVQVEALVKPLAETLERYQENLQAIESNRQMAYGELRNELLGVGQTQELLRRETANLVSALRRPHVRGRWGELTLRRVAELAGMVEHCDFSEQPTIIGEDGRYQPDMMVLMPGELCVPVDSKAPLDAYLDAVAATAEDQKNMHLTRHASQVRAHMEQLSSKAYWDQFEKTPEFTVLFLPGEPFFSAAVERDPALIEDAIQNRVLIATPVTLVALLKAVSYGWRQEDIARNAREISELGKQVYERVSILWEHFSNLRAALLNAVEAFGKAVGSLESRLLPSVRRFKELGVTTADDIPQMEPIDQVPRSLGLPPEKKQDEPV